MRGTLLHVSDWLEPLPATVVTCSDKHAHGHMGKDTSYSWFIHTRMCYTHHMLLHHTCTVHENQAIASCHRSPHLPLGTLLPEVVLATTTVAHIVWGRLLESPATSPSGAREPMLRTYIRTHTHTHKYGTQYTTQRHTTNTLLHD